jgi:L-lysine epsilon oxidase-like protein
MAVTYRIHPAIGIARVGDSPDEFFIGPEAPGTPPELKKPGDASAHPGTHKDSQRRIKRQGARFRVYESTADAAGVVTGVREITGAEAEIEWEVHLANRKAAAPLLEDPGRRNEGTPERDLIIDAGPHRIRGTDQPMQELRGAFMKTIDVKLGDLLTDAAGRLIVLGGHGKSQSLPGSALEDFADNDGWCDDVADGPVRATVTLRGRAAAIAADPAWVIVAPPDFAPPIENVVTLYDAVYNVMAGFDPGLDVSDATPVSFTRDIYPILRRVSLMHWVSKVAARRHGVGGDQHFLSRLTELASNKSDDSEAREEVFGALRKPAGGGGNMPKLPPQAASKAPGAALTKAQYARMERWSQGKFDADWTGTEPAPAPLDDLPARERPHALDRAALESCVGGPFFPGIEASRVMLDQATYDAKRPFRINAQLRPGTLTERMAVPWQADFTDCSIEDGADWWPGQRPNEVRRGQEKHAAWTPDWDYQDMVDKWSQLGFVVAKKVGNGVEYVEDERFLEPSPPSP